MVIRIHKFGICCDRCRKISSNMDGNSYFGTYAQAEENVPDDWLKVGRKYYCPDCQKYNEEKDRYEPIKDEKEPKKQEELFDLFESDYNNITLDKKKVIEMFNNVADKVKDILIDVKQCGIHFEDLNKASSEFANYCRLNKIKIDEDTERYGKYQHNLFEQIKKNVNSKMLDDFNNIFTNTSTDKYFHTYKRKRGGNTNKQTLFDAIYCEITNLPLNRLNDAFDEKGHFLGINNIPYDTSLVTKASVNKDTDGNPIFAFQYKRNKYGYFECLRVRFDKEWFVLYEEL